MVPPFPVFRKPLMFLKFNKNHLLLYFKQTYICSVIIVHKISKSSHIHGKIMHIHVILIKSIFSISMVEQNSQNCFSTGNLSHSPSLLGLYSFLFLFAMNRSEKYLTDSEAHASNCNWNTRQKNSLKKKEKKEKKPVQRIEKCTITWRSTGLRAFEGQVHFKT